MRAVSHSAPVATKCRKVKVTKGLTASVSTQCHVVDHPAMYGGSGQRFLDRFLKIVCGGELRYVVDYTDKLKLRT